ncbi:hypothetical protein CBM2589_U10004 [Cupriavidus taiwanensis]|uniref:DUF7673 domain-containing protein n=1 Tax=Cupriavidus taiwanensis TaxID=164546 RepID=A0A375CQF7_9BURK|nr:hypothetical protein [Cupriavidus taiwanensis]SOY77487.1 hypothetical protein CBM2589_U10004 [Cupriavidus taiwanensis]
MRDDKQIEDTPEECARADQEWRREMQEAKERQDAAHEAGIPALRRLFDIANGHSGQCRRVAAFLLSLYNGQRFPFDMTDFRAVDQAIFEDMMLVLRMDKHLKQEVHNYFDNGGKAFEKLADDWNLHARGWEVTSEGFVRRHGEYQCRITVVRGDGPPLRWAIDKTVIEPTDDGYGYSSWKEIASDTEYRPSYAADAIQKWFDRGGENPHSDE